MTSDIQSGNKFTEFLNTVIELPLWIKQVLYLNLKKNLEDSVTKSYMDMMTGENIFQLYTAKLTFRGKKELEDRERQLDPNVYKFLDGATKDLSNIEITIQNLWTLEECAKSFTDALDLELICAPESAKLIGTAQYLASKIRLGEYFTRIDKITIDQLDEALRTQKQIEESTGDKMGIAGVMLNKGFLSEQDIQAILLVKDESKKRFIFNVDLGTQPSPSVDGPDQAAVMARLKKENDLLKNQLRKILNISKK